MALNKDLYLSFSLDHRFSSAGVTLPSGNVWMFGGENVFPSGGNWVAVSTSVLMYNVASNQMSVINTNSPGNATRVMHTATLAADGSAIYIIGGLTVSAFGAVPATQTNPADLNIWSFNLASSQWQTISPKLNSPNIGQGRSSHTATLLPHTTSILIFGGYQNSLPNCRLLVTLCGFDFNLSLFILKKGKLQMIMRLFTTTPKIHCLMPGLTSLVRT
ncbi:hypothetical protein DM01DRAFT_1131066 [Hesseltinella vesiculosa]|uniref:Galactose oxidase n=1 Tax=Hesseltinella vesiculosa TaxID=101127 RepID=A0A1X2GA90_9FUNG|nr:hypothetical protein DM01DRAFT_1131066 [Hesseltinella vesiculosa]